MTYEQVLQDGHRRYNFRLQALRLHGASFEVMGVEAHLGGRCE